MIDSDIPCPRCGETFDHSAVTFCMFIGLDNPVIWMGQEHLHLHHAVVTTVHELSIRGSVERWTRHYRYRLRRFLHSMASRVA
jgi:hypothetical protein